MKWTDEEHNYLVELINQRGTRWTILAQLMSERFNKTFTYDQVRAHHRMNPDKQETPKTPAYKEATEIMADGSHKSDKLLEMSSAQLKDVDYLLEAHGFDKVAWELISAKNNIWNSYSKQDGIMTQYSSKITVKPRIKDFTVDDIKDFFTDLTKHYQSPRHSPTRFKDGGKLLEIHVDDLHLGKLCFIGDTYNEEIAEKRFFYIINDVLSKTADYDLEKIVFIWSNDFFHFDGLSKTTTGGTPQDTNLMYQQMFKLGVDMLVKAIDLLSQHAPVDTMYVGANHDKVTSYFATEYLFAWFRNNENISVDNHPRTRKYYEFGNSLIQFSHGHSEKKRLGQTMQVDMREAWGRTLYHEVHAGHIHSSKMTTEDNGVIIRHLSSPTGTDVWHDESGYVGAVKKAEHFLWDKERGLEMIIHTPIVS